ncbi:MAG: peptidylprolyl isomerase [Oscillospiraceae bacterium]|nr:peptidylprolyl isomerase [Oscillospiraceae bacterium]
MRFELYPHIAPQSVFNFIYLARQGFYDGLGFHRILENFMAQGGCPQGTGGGNPGYAIFGEFSDNGFENNLLHTRGVLSMARATDYNSAGSQFFIMFGTSAFLDGGYAAFGLITEGLDVVDSLEATPNAGRAGNGFVEPEDRPIIRTITIDSDVVVPLPDKLPRP